MSCTYCTVSDQVATITFSVLSINLQNSTTAGPASTSLLVVEKHSVFGLSI